jgi:hypothetical protein
MTESQIAYCGLDCFTCPIHQATLEPDTRKKYAMRIAIARECSVHYGMNLQPEEVNDCDGCRADTGRLFSSCRNCAIRKCATARELQSCAYCDEYACDKLEEMFRSDPEAKSRLEKIRS